MRWFSTKNKSSGIQFLYPKICNYMTYNLLRGTLRYTGVISQAKSRAAPSRAAPSRTAPSSRARRRRAGRRGHGIDKAMRQIRKKFGAWPGMLPERVRYGICADAKRQRPYARWCMSLKKSISRRPAIPDFVEFAGQTYRFDRPDTLRAHGPGTDPDFHLRPHQLHPDAQTRRACYPSYSSTTRRATSRIISS